MDLDKVALDTILTLGKLEPFIEGGIAVEDFQGPFKSVAAYIFDYWKNPRFKGQIPTESVLHRQAPTYKFQKSKEQVEWVIAELRRRTTYNKIADVATRVGAAMKDNQVDEAAKILYTGGLEVAALAAQTQVVNLTRNMAERRLRYENRRDKVDLYGIPSGFEWFDKWTLGWQPGDLGYVLGKRGTGKTWFLLLMARAAQLSNVPVMLLSREMDVNALERRYDALHAALPYQAFRRGELGYALEKTYYEALDGMSKLSPFYIPKFDGPCTPTTIQALARQMGCRWIGIDGVYLLDDDDGGKQWEKHYNIARGLKKMCTTDRVVCVVNNQLNREEDPRAATLDNAAYSDAYSQFADVAMKLVQGADERINREMLLHLLKLREEDLPTYPIRIRWDFESMSFGHLGDEDSPVIDPEEMNY